MSTNTRNSMDNKKYRIIAIVLIMLILAGFVCLYVIADAKAAGYEPASAPWTGAATEPQIDEADTYLISSPEELAWVAGVVNGTITEGINIPTDSSFAGKTVKLTQNIILNAEIQMDADGNITNYDSLLQWTPIGGYNPEDKTFIPFSGTFDGVEYAVKGLYINDDTKIVQGLFGYVDQGTIKDVFIADSYIYASAFVGGIAGMCNNGIIENCINNGKNSTVSTGKKVEGSNAGGIVGSAEGNCSIINCYNYGDIKGRFSVGGIAGRSVGSDDEIIVCILNCSNTGLINGDSISGGLIGKSSYSEIINCWNTAAIHGSTVGGVVGQADASDIINCYNRGNLFVDKDNPDNIYTAGGICGEITAGTIENCYSTGAIVSDYVDAVIGGIAGSIVTDTENDPAVSTVIDYCYWLLSAAQTINGVDRSDAEKLGVGINNDNEGTCTTFSFTEAQGKGMDNDASAIIGDSDYITSFNSLVLTLNTWIYDYCTHASEETDITKYSNWLTNYDDYPSYFSGCYQCVEPSVDETGTYLISTPEELAWVAGVVNETVTEGNNIPAVSSFEGATVKLVNDIVLNEEIQFDTAGYVTNTDTLKQWMPIGKYTSAGFSGCFDGSDHVVKGLYINGLLNNQGLFGDVEGGTVKNISIEDSYICVGFGVGGIAGSCTDGIIENCDYYGSINAAISAGKGGTSGGGIVGVASGKSSILNCCNDGNITGPVGVGGIVGLVRSNDNIICIDNCSNSGDIKGSYIGGIAGRSVGSDDEIIISILNCSNTGLINGDSIAGGLIGEMRDTEIINCWNTAAIHGSTVGGVVGQADASDIINNYNRGNLFVDKDNPDNIYTAGGICGEITAGIVENCYSTGAIEANYSDTSIGGIAGRITADGAKTSQLENCYWLLSAAQTINGVDRSDTEKLGVGINNDNGGTCTTFSFTEAQGKGMGNDAAAVIAADSSYANTNTLLTALHNWVAVERTTDKLYYDWLADDEVEPKNNGYPVLVEEEDVVSGNCGEALSWTYNMISETLTISGAGDMYDYSSDSFAPWYEQYRNQIKKVTVESGVTSIGDNAFVNCDAISNISLPDSVVAVGKYAFDGTAWFNEQPEDATICLNKVVLGYKGDVNSDTTITIPEDTICIADSAFENLYDLRNITIGNNVKHIGDYAFLDCDSLSSVIIPDSVLSIGDSAFASCDSLSSVHFGRCIENIENSAFINCYNLNSISIPDSVISIGDSAFASCSNLSSVTLGRCIENIGQSAFIYCYNLNSITIPDSVKSIGDAAFESCSNLSIVTIGDSVVKIGEGAFRYCNLDIAIFTGNAPTEFGESVFEGAGFEFKICFSEENSGWTTPEWNSYPTVSFSEINTGGECGENLTWSFDFISATLTISGSGEMYNYSYAAFAPWHKELRSLIENVIIEATVTSIGSYAFYECSNIIDITIPEAINSIGEYAFAYCNKLLEILIPENVTILRDYVFYNCNSLTELKIHQNIVEISSCAFISCSNLTAITVDAGNAVYCSINGVLFNGNKTSIILYPQGKTNESYEIPDTVSVIESCAFASCNRIIEVTMPSGLTDIGEEAFYDCSKLENLNIPDGVINIGRDAFHNCDGLTKITIPGSVRSIDEWSFNNCDNLEEVVISNGVTSIGAYAFNYCYSLSDISLPDSIIAVGSNAFNDTKWYDEQTDGIVCLNKVVLGYKGEMNSDVLELPEEIVCIADYAFYAFDFGGVIISDNVKSIGNYSFVSCSNLNSIIIPDSVSAIGEAAFQSCTALKNVIIGSNVSEIQNSTFYNCSSLSSITMPDSITNIGNYAFYNCNVMNYAYFLGNAPEIEPNGLLTRNDYFKIYYLEGKTGWTTPEWNDYPAIPISADGIASGSCGDNVTWSLDVFKGDLTVSGNGAMDNYSAKQTAPWELSKTEIKTVTIAEGVTNIGDTAFKECSELTKITMPDTVARIGSYAFKGCSKLTTADIPDSVAVIEEGAFFDCTALDDLKLSGNVREIAYRSFASCSSLATLTVPDSVQTINEYAFYNCQDLNRVQLSANVREIACRSFASCSSLPEIEMPATLTDLGDSAFKNDAALHKALFKGDAPQPWLDSVFDGTAADLQIHYYEGTTGWGTQGNLVPINVAGISIASEPLVSTYLVQDTLDSDGLAVNVNYADEYSRTITSGFDLEYDFSSAGEKEVIVSYCGQETTFNVTVNEAAGKMLTGLTAEFNQGSNIFYVTDKLADNLQVITDNLVVTASYADDSSQTLTSANYEVSGDLSVIDDNNLSTLTIKYVEDGLSRKATFTVKVNDLVLIEWFPDTNFCSYVYTTVLGKTETDGNASSYALSLADIETIEACTELDVADKAVSSLKGIERFTALEVLNCQNNNITELDISGCSALQVLNCSNNRFTVLNLTNNTALISLDCSNNNVRYLDVSTCIALEELNCSHNAISGTLDVSNFTSLTSLDCSNNQLTGLTVSGCSALEKLNCSHNAISGTLDVSNFTELTSLDCSNNQLTGLTVSGCSALQKLNCSNNALGGTLDVSACTELEEFDCSGNPEITELIFDEQAKPQLLLRSREVVTLAAAATGDRKLKQLNCSGTAIKDIDVSSFPQLEVLNVSNTAIEKLDLGTNDKLTELDVSGCGSLQAVTTQLIFIGEKSDDTVVVDLSAEATKGIMTYPDSTADITYDKTTNIVTFNTLTAAANGFSYSQILNETGTQLAVTGKVIYVEKIDITTAATTSHYYVGDSLTTDGLVLQVTYKDCTTNDSIIKELKSDFSATIEAEYYTDGKFIQAGTEVPVTVSFKGCSTMYDVVVKSRPVTEIAEVTYQQVEGKDYDIVTVNFGLALTQPSGYIIVAVYDDNNQMLASSLKQVHSGETSTECIIRGAANCTNIKAFLVNDVNKCQPLTAAVAASLE